MADDQKKKIFDAYLTTHYARCEKTNFNNENEVIELLKRNRDPLEYNLSKLFEQKIDKSAKILDLGCGYGSFLYFLQTHRYKNVTGIDISSEEVKLCKKIFNLYEIYQKDIFDFVHETREKYDVVYLSHVIEHIDSDKIFEFLEIVKNILKDGGHLIIVVPNSSAYFNSLATRYGDLTHKNGFTDNSLDQALMLTGFKEIELKNFHGVGNFILNLIRKCLLFIFEIFIQILGYDKQAIYTPSLLAIARKR